MAREPLVALLAALRQEIEITKANRTHDHTLHMISTEQLERVLDAAEEARHLAEELKVAREHFSRLPGHPGTLVAAWGTALKRFDEVDRA